MDNAFEFPKKKDLKIRAQFTRNMFISCSKLCIEHEGKKELNANEQNCLDRCAAKYLIVGDYVSKVYQRVKTEENKG